MLVGKARSKNISATQHPFCNIFKASTLKLVWDRAKMGKLTTKDRLTETFSVEDELANSS